MNFEVQVNSLVEVYDWKLKALNGVDLNVKPLEAFALLGKGGGEATLARILTTRLKLAGEVHVFGLNVACDGESYLPQDSELTIFPLNIYGLEATATGGLPIIGGRA